MNSKVKYIAINAMIAAVYAALTLALAPICYGSIQCRVSEILVFLAFYKKEYFPGLIIGCFLANLGSPMLAYDLVFGVGATIIACFGMYYSKNLFMGAFIGSLANGILVGAELALAYQIPFVINAAYVFIGEFAVLLVGAIVFKAIEKNAAVYKYLEA